MPTRPRASLRFGLTTAVPLAAILVFAVPAVLAADRGVRIEDFAFGPATITIDIGDRVRWTNRDNVEHTATARNGSFDTGLLANGESHTIRFTAAGRYRYVCTPHPSMTGTVVVQAGGGARPPNTSTIGNATETEAAGGGLDPAAVMIGGLAFLFVERRLRRRLETGPARHA